MLTESPKQMRIAMVWDIIGAAFSVCAYLTMPFLFFKLVIFCFFAGFLCNLGRNILSYHEWVRLRDNLSRPSFVPRRVPVEKILDEYDDDEDEFSGDTAWR